MRLALLLALLFLAAGALAAPAPLPKPPKPDDAKADLKAMQGTWARTTLLIDNRDSKPAGALVTMTITDRRMVFSQSDTWTLTLDAKTNPKKIDAEAEVGGSAFFGVYKVEKDRLTICWLMSQKGKNERPGGFNPAQPKVWFQVYERVKP